MYSAMAKVAYGAIRLFELGRVNLIDDVKMRNVLQSKCKKTTNLLRQRFKVDRSYTIKLQSLLSMNCYKEFRKSIKAKEIYRTILMLFGMERFFDGEDADIHYDTKGDYVFFRPEQLYEKFVYKYYQDKSLGNRVKVQEQVEKEYDIKSFDSSSEEVFHLISKPDLLIENEMTSTKEIVDAKWKVLAKASNNTFPVSAADILKLKRDLYVHGANKATLAYCVIEDNTLIGSFEDDGFTFSVEEVPLDLKYNQK